MVVVRSSSEGGKKEWVQRSMQFYLGMQRRSKFRLYRWLCYITEMYIFKGSILWYVNSISVNLWCVWGGWVGRCLYVWRPVVNIRWILQSFSLYCLRQGLSLILKFTNSVRVAGQQTPGILLSLPPLLQDYRCLPCVCIQVLWIKLSSLCLLRKQSTDWTISLVYAAIIWVRSSLSSITLYDHTL